MASPPPSSSPVFINAAAKTWRFQNTPGTGSQSPLGPSPVQALHRSLPDYGPSPLRSLPALADSLGLSHVLLKDESSRFGLPSFKILGASWAVPNAVAAHLGVSLPGSNDSTTRLTSHGSNAIHFLRELVASRKHSGGSDGECNDLTIVTCTEGNWGRAVARMAGYIGVKAIVYVPDHVHVTTRELIRGEGAEVRVVEGGGYEAALEAAKRELGNGQGRLMVIDTSWEGNEQVPKWVVEGYQTMLDETDEQVLDATGGKPATHAIVPVGCGSIGQAVTQHFKSAVREQNGVPAATVLAVEPDTAACLKASLENGKMTTVATGDSIMNGMNCGTLSTTAWPVLATGVDGSVVVSDKESHNAVQESAQLGIKAGPCGAAALAALKRICETEKARLGLDHRSVVVLFCTEGPKEYAVPG